MLLIGPGEAKEEDIGIAGGIGEGLLFKKGEIIRKIKQEDIVQELKQEIVASLASLASLGQVQSRHLLSSQTEEREKELKQWK